MINWARVEELASEVGADGYLELRDVFLGEVEDALQRIEIAAGMPALERDLHFLKGSALNIGLTEFACLCSAGEDAAKANRLTAEDLSAITECYKISRRDLIAGARAV